MWDLLLSRSVYAFSLRQAYSEVSTILFILHPAIVHVYVLLI